MFIFITERATHFLIKKIEKHSKDIFKKIPHDLIAPGSSRRFLPAPLSYSLYSMSLCPWDMRVTASVHAGMCAHMRVASRLLQLLSVFKEHLSPPKCELTDQAGLAGWCVLRICPAPLPKHQGYNRVTSWPLGIQNQVFWTVGT